jgi:hypothetical protein
MYDCPITSHIFSFCFNHTYSELLQSAHTQFVDLLIKIKHVLGHTCLQTQELWGEVQGMYYNYGGYIT